jgi:lambda family phage holin
MPDKNPDLWAAVWRWLESATYLHAAGLAMVISILRAAYDGKETRWQRRYLEASICGLLTLACFGLVNMMGWPDSIAVTLGGSIGFLGVETLRAQIIKRLGNKG